MSLSAYSDVLDWADRAIDAILFQHPDEAAEAAVRVAASTLAGDLFFVDPDISVAIGQAATALPDGVALEASSVPGPAGAFIYEPRWPVLALDLMHLPADIKVLAVGWELTACRHDSRDARSCGELHNGMCGLYLSVIGDSGEQGIGFSRPVYIGFGRPIVELPDKWLVTVFEFIRQRVLVVDRRSADRAARRRYQQRHEAEAPLIQVIALRRSERLAPAEPAAGEKRDWACRWVVRGHWRQQWYRAAGRHRPKWIATHVKGPGDQPLRHPERLFAVVR